MSLELWQIAPWLPSVRMNVLFCPASFSLISESFLAHISMCGSWVVTGLVFVLHFLPLPILGVPFGMMCWMLTFYCLFSYTTSLQVKCMLVQQVSTPGAGFAEGCGLQSPPSLQMSSLPAPSAGIWVCPTKSVCALERCHLLYCVFYLVARTGHVSERLWAGSSSCHSVLNSVRLSLLQILVGHASMSTRGTEACIQSCGLWVCSYLIL